VNQSKVGQRTKKKWNRFQTDRSINTLTVKLDLLGWTPFLLLAVRIKRDTPSSSPAVYSHIPTYIHPQFCRYVMTDCGDRTGSSNRTNLELLTFNYDNCCSVCHIMLSFLLRQT
jgi:hypothetical protein